LEKFGRHLGSKDGEDRTDGKESGKPDTQTIGDSETVNGRHHVLGSAKNALALQLGRGFHRDAKVRNEMLVFAMA
jgi:hypothetical protein